MFPSHDLLGENVDKLRSQYAGDILNNVDPASAYNRYNQLFKANNEKIIGLKNDLFGLGYRYDQVEPIIKRYSLNKKTAESIMNNQLIDMPISVGITGTKEQRIQRYIDLGRRLPLNLLDRMLRDDLEAGKIKSSDVKIIQNSILMSRVF